ncbi:MAG TPA: energy transducer TonB [Nitrospirales bacterium]|nr:energy transducer TonB [Nitrospirales bacterium]HIO69736.1 energy transducer TonB [Nitrospirales bacterium]
MSMSGHSVLLSVGFHVIALGGASFFIPNSAPKPHDPIEVVLVEFAQPEHFSKDPVPFVDVVKAAPPEMSTQELEIANDVVSFPKGQHDVADIPAIVEESVAKPAKAISDSDAPENNVAHGEQLVALPTDAESSNVDEMSEIMRQDVRYLSSAPPRYPRLARKRGWEGTVLLEVEVLSTGNVSAIRVTHSSGHKVLDRAAQKAVETWRFSVSGADGLGVTATVEIPVTFALDSPGARNRG